MTTRVRTTRSITRRVAGRDVAQGAADLAYFLQRAPKTKPQMAAPVSVVIERSMGLLSNVIRTAVV